MMRGTDETIRSLFSYVDLEKRIPPRHPQRKVRMSIGLAIARRSTYRTDLKPVYKCIKPVINWFHFMPSFFRIGS